MSLSNRAIRCVVEALVLVTLFAACGGDKKQSVVNANYIGFDAALSELKSLDNRADAKTAPVQLRKVILVQNLFATVVSANKQQRASLAAYLKEKLSAPYDEEKDENQTLPTDHALTTLPAHQSLRLPVNSYCLNVLRSSPEEDTRYRLSTKHENNLRQLVFGYMLETGKSDNDDFQDLVWHVDDDLYGDVKFVSGLSTILDYYGIPYTPDEKISDVNNKPETAEKAAALQARDAALREGLGFELVSNNFGDGDLIITNTSDAPIAITRDHLQVRMVPVRSTDQTKRNTHNPFAADVPEAQPQRGIQNIFVAGAGYNRLEGFLRSLFAELYNFQNALDQMSGAPGANGGLDPNNYLFQPGVFYSSDLYAQGEYEAAHRVVNEINALAHSVAMGADLATAFTPGANDFRDAYEAITGEDLITGQPLSPFQRSLAIASLYAGNAAAERKVADSLGHAAVEAGERDADELYDTAKKMADELEPAHISQNAVDAAKRGMAALEERFGRDALDKASKESPRELIELANLADADPQYATKLIDYAANHPEIGLDVRKIGLMAEGKDGLTKFVSLKDYMKYYMNSSVITGAGPTPDTGGPTAFFVPTKDVPDILARAGRDRAKLEQLLGLKEGQLGDGRVFQLDTTFSFENNVRLPTGKEPGVNDLHIQGSGRTLGGYVEVVEDNAPLLPGKANEVDGYYDP